MNTLTLLPLLNQLIQHKNLPVDNKVSAILLISTIVQSITTTGYHDNIIEVRITCEELNLVLLNF